MRSIRSPKPEVAAAAGVRSACCGWPCSGRRWPQPAHYHALRRPARLWGLPFALDVLSQPAVRAGGRGWRCWLLRGRSPAARAAAPVQRADGLRCSSPACARRRAARAGTTWQPDDAGLAVDRCGMAVAFAGLLGLAAAGRVSERAGGRAGAGRAAAGAAGRARSGRRPATCCPGPWCSSAAWR